MRLKLSAAFDAESQNSPGAPNYQVWWHWYCAGVAPVLFVQPFTAYALGRRTVSDKFDLRQGVPQGSCPLLFTLCTSKLFEIKNSLG